MCPTCKDTEQKAEAESLLHAEERVKESNNSFIERQAADMQKQLDTTISIRTDIFNANFPSIMDMKREIEADPTIENKIFAHAMAVRARFDQFKKVLFELDDAKAQINSNMHAMQSYMNDLSNKLKAEERAKLQLENINYKPASPKVPGTTKVKAPKAPSVPKAKIDKHLLRVMAAALNLPEYVIQITCTSKNMTVEQACEHLQKIDAVKSGMAPKTTEN